MVDVVIDPCGVRLSGNSGTDIMAANSYFLASSKATAVWLDKAGVQCINFSNPETNRTLPLYLAVFLTVRKIYIFRVSLHGEPSNLVLLRVA